MKKLLFFSFTVVAIIAGFTACTSQDEPEANVTEVSAVSSLENDPLLIKLQALNDSLIAQSQLQSMSPESRSIWSKFKEWWKKSVKTITADLNGALKGASVGFSIGGGIGASIGGIIVGTAYSLEYNLRGEQTGSIEGLTTKKTLIQQDSVEHALASSYLIPSLMSNERERCKTANIKLPSNHVKSFETGLRHNVSLRQLMDKEELPYTLEDAANGDEEMIYAFRLMHGPKFKEYYSTPVSIVGLPTVNRINPTRTEKVVYLFAEALKDYPNNLDDIKTLIDSYISEIEKDETYADAEKSILYSVFSTAVCSAHLWYEKTYAEFEEYGRDE